MLCLDEKRQPQKRAPAKKPRAAYPNTTKGAYIKDVWLLLPRGGFSPERKPPPFW